MHFLSAFIALKNYGEGVPQENRLLRLKIGNYLFTIFFAQKPDFSIGIAMQSFIMSEN